MSSFASAVERMDRIQAPVLLWINAALAAFVAIAHGGAVLVNRFGKAPEISDAIPKLYVSTSLALLGLALSVVGLMVPRARTATLRVQAILLLVFALGMVYFAVDLIFSAPPPSEKFAWNPVLFAFVVAYPIYLARRVLLTPNMSASRTWLFAPVWGVLVSALLSAVVIWRVWNAAT